MTDKNNLKRIKSIMTLADRGSTPGERAAAMEALKRLGKANDYVLAQRAAASVEASIIAANDLVYLMPVTMVAPTKACVHGLSRVFHGAWVDYKDLPRTHRSLILISRDEDGVSNPRWEWAYNGHIIISTEEGRKIDRQSSRYAPGWKPVCIPEGCE